MLAREGSCIFDGHTESTAMKGTISFWGWWGYLAERLLEIRKTRKKTTWGR